MKKKKNKNSMRVTAIIINLVVIAAFAFGVYWAVINFDTVKATLSGTEIYVADDLEAAYEDGYNTALTNEAEYQTLIDGYRTTIANLNDSITLITAERDDLTTIKTNLEAAAVVDVETITSLNTQITALNSQVSDLETQVQNTIDYYEGVLAEIDFTTRATATFILDGETYSTRSIEINAVGITVTEPQSDSYDFLGWSLDGVNVVDLSTYTVTEDVTFTALLDYKYEIDFILEGEIYSTQTVYEDNFVTTTTPESVVYADWDNRSGYYGYDFLGWSVDGVNVVDLSTYTITADVTFTAVLDYKVAVTYWGIFEDGTFDGAGGQLRCVIQSAGEIIDSSAIETYYPDLLGYSLTNIPTVEDISNLEASENTFIYVVFAN